MAKLYAFDVDETLEISNGPVKLQDMTDLRSQGHIVGICGNWSLLVKLAGWQHLASFINCTPVVQLTDGTIVGDKAWFMSVLKTHVPAKEYIMVGNVFGEKNSLGFICGSHDSVAAEKAGWRFIKEDNFAAGER